MLIPFWIILNKKAKPAMATKTVPNIFGNISAIPQQLYMALNQIWVQPFEGNQLRLGFNDLISNLVHAEKLVFKKNIGESIVRGELLAELHSNGKQLKIVSPVSGIVRKTNTVLHFQMLLLINMAG
jgi:glycine cleavage system H lipoate-binding protein